jgi:hypothetical protein
VKRWLILMLLLLTAAARGGERSSTDYQITADVLNSGGGRSDSADYRLDGSLGGVVDVSTAAFNAERIRHGFIPQLANVTGVALLGPAVPSTVVGGQSITLTAAQALDDGTYQRILGGNVVWSVVSGPLTDLGGGVFSAAPVTQRTTAVVRGVVDGVACTLSIAVKGVPAVAQTTNPTVSTLGSLTVRLQGPDGGFFDARVPGKVPGWRLAGETDWRSSKDVVDGLCIPAGGTAGGFAVEFESILDFSQTPPFILSAPPPMLVTVEANKPASCTGIYKVTGGATGGLEVLISPAVVAENPVPEQRAGWRFLGEGDAAWRDTGANLRQLPTGSYLIEFKPVPGYAPVPPKSVQVSLNGRATVQVLYQPVEGVAGDLPQLLDLDQVTSESPYEFVGQIHSNAGFGSGVALTDRVVLTAAHVIFDDASLSFAQGTIWQFERYLNTREPRALPPRGAYVLSSYAAERADADPGVGSPASQEADAAALYFIQSAANGRGSGYLLSSPPDDGWLGEDRLKILAGYPTDTSYDDAPVVSGRMSATAPANVLFTRSISSQAPDVFTTTDIAGLSGMSGGPLFVQYEDGTYYPAGIYLGGNQRSVVRRIDGAVQHLIDRAILSAEDDGNHVDLGCVLVTLRGFNDAGPAYSVRVNLTPVNATWHFAGDSTPHAGGQSVQSPTSNPTIVFNRPPDPGYFQPADYTVDLVPYQESQLNVVYPQARRPVFQTQALPFAGRTLPYLAGLEAKNATSYSADAATDQTLKTLGLKLSTTGVLSGTISAESPIGTYGLVVIAINRRPDLSTAQNYSLVVSAPGKLSVTCDPAKGSVTGVPGPFVPIGADVALIVKAKPGFLFSEWRGTGAAGIPTSDPKLQFQMGADVSITAFFVENFFPDLAGSYRGLVQLSDQFDDLGLFTITLTPAGLATGRLTLGARSLTFSRVPLDPQGAAHISLDRGGSQGPLELLLQADPDSDFLRGTVTTQGGTVHSFTAGKLATALDPRLNIGSRYTLVFPHPTGAGLPQGDGFGVVTVKPNGAINFSGQLGDGVPIPSYDSNLTQSGKWPFFYVFDPKGGVVTGLLSFGDVPSASDVAGPLIWIKPAKKNATTYPDGFQATLFAIGSKFSSSPLLAYTNATAIFGSAALSSGTPLPLVLNSKGAVTGPAGNLFLLSVTPNTGQLSGSFAEPAPSVRRRRFDGVVFQKTSTAYGLFTGSGQDTGFVEITGRP